MEQEFEIGQKVICIDGPDILDDGIIGRTGEVRKYFKDANLYEIYFGVHGSYYLAHSELKLTTK